VIAMIFLAVVAVAIVGLSCTPARAATWTTEPERTNP